MIYNETSAADRFAIEESIRDDTPIEVVGPNGGHCTRIVYVPWSQVDNAIEDLLGAVTLRGQILTFTLPQSFPHGGKKMYYLADEVHSEPKGYHAVSNTGGTRIVQHKKAKLRVTYRPFPRRVGSFWPDGRQVIMREDIKPTGEFMTIPGRKLYWDAGSTEPLGNDEAPGVFIAGGEWVCKMTRLPSLPPVIWGDYVGRVNSNPLTSPKYRITFPAETLLMMQPDITWGIGRTGAISWTVEATMLWKPFGWNRFPKAGSATMTQIYAGGSAYDPYLTAALENVLLVQ